MATAKKSTSRRKRSVAKRAPAAPSKKKRFVLPTWRQVGTTLAWPFVTSYKKLRKKRADSTHKSFVRTRRRDKTKTPIVEGYIAFPWYVARMLWNHKWLYMRFIILFVFLSIIAIGTMQTSNLASVNSTIDSMGKDGVVTPVLRALSTVGASIGGALNSNLSDVQYLYMSALYILALLSVVWLLRQQLAGNKANVRDAVYSSASPIAAEYVLLSIGILQLIPFAIAVIIYMVAMSMGFLNGGIETAMFSLALVFIAVLTLYFMTTTLFALFIVSIPGTYPLKAYKAARLLVAGQRMRLLMRLLWMVVIVLASLFVVLVPTIIIANSLNVGNTVVIPLAFQFAVASSIVYGTSYAYLLYRRMIDEPADKD